MKYYSIGQFAKLIGKSTQTLRNWYREGTLKPHHIAESSYRYYSQEQLNKKTIAYCRVSTHKQEDDILRQVDNVKTYMYSKGYKFEVIADIGSGINYNKKGLNQLTVFSCRLQGKRSNKAKKRIKELIEDDTSQES